VNNKLNQFYFNHVSVVAKLVSVGACVLQMRDTNLVCVHVNSDKFITGADRLRSLSKVDERRESSFISPAESTSAPHVNK